MAGLRAHLISSFTGAANDNLFKQVIAVSLLGLARQQLGPGQDADRRGELYVLLAGAAFLLPFVLLAPLAGALGDRLPKHLVMRAMRTAEIPLCVLGGVGLWLNSLPMMLFALAGLATQSAIFAPVKLSLMPDLVAPERLARANALLQTVTLVAIVGGSALAFSADERFLAYLPFAMAPGAAVLAIGVFLAVIGLCAAWRVPALPAAAPDTRLRVFDLFGSLRRLFQTRRVVAPAISLALFWGLAAAAHLMIVPAADQAYHLGQAGNPLFGLALIAGIVVGSLLAPRLVSPAYPAGLPLLGAAIAAVGLIIAGLVAHAPGSHPASFGAWLVITGIGAGLWEIPLQVLVISRAPAASRNQIQAAAGILGAMVMIAATGVCWVLTQVCDLRAALVLTALGSVTLITAAGFAWCYRQQVAAWAMARLVGVIYRVRVEGAEHFPVAGGCLVVCNHLSYADGVVLAANLPRPGRFLVYRRFVDLPVIGWGLRAAGVIPVAAEDARRAMLASIDAAVEAASRGEVVVIFPEGKITRGNQLDAFRSGMERIASRANVPVVPVHLDGLWGALASRAKVRTFIPLRRVVLRIGSPLPSNVLAAEARNQVMTLSYEQAQERAERDHRTLGHAVLAAARRHPARVAVRDAGGRLSFLGLVGAARALLPLLALDASEQRVGVLLPPGRGGAIVNLALALAGRTAVNLNHTAGEAQVKRMCELAEVRTVISATPYLRRINVATPGRMALLDELLPKAGKLTLALRSAGGLLLPTNWMARARADDTAAIVFSSGSTGDPKGVELTHRQILANLESIALGLELNADDVLLNPLPLFHSFGLVPGMWLGLVQGMASAAHPDPTDAKALGSLASEVRATFLISTPTFVRGYLRRVEPEQFKSLRFAVVGAERCPGDLKAAFKERFGADLLEGYGCTELAPVVAVNLPTVARDGMEEKRHRDGSVGRPLPGVQVITVDPETRAHLPTGSEGLLVVRSAARMRGYLNRPDLTDAAFVHGGYNTGDIGKVDVDGFVHITGRLARFAKIAGEMVPLDNIELALQALAGLDIEVAVAAVADPTKGERLIVLHHGWTGSAEELLKAADELPTLWRPKPRDVYAVEAIPKLGTGKRDLAGLKRLAAEKVAAPTAA